MIDRCFAVIVGGGDAGPTLREGKLSIRVFAVALREGKGTRDWFDIAALSNGPRAKPERFNWS